MQVFQRQVDTTIVIYTGKGFYSFDVVTFGTGEVFTVFLFVTVDAAE